MDIFFKEENNFGILSFDNGMILYDMVGVLKEHFEKLIDNINENINIIIDFNKISFIDSSGLGFLVNICKKIREKGNSIILTGLQESVNDIFRLTGVSPYFTILQSIKEAKDFFNKE